MMVKVKICGITSATDARMAAAAGADAIGLNFYRGSARCLAPDRARAICQVLPPFLSTVGLFVDSPVQRVQDVMRHCGLDFAQLHGRETATFVRRLEGIRVIKAVRVRGEEDLGQLDRYQVDAFLLDAFVEGRPGGTGQTFDWDLCRAAANRFKVILAGGLNPGNVAEAVRRGRPFAVDVASGVESAPGVKDRKLVTAFVREAKSVRL